MGERVGRKPSYSTVRSSRRVEIIFVICVIAIGIVITLALIAKHRNTLVASERCGPEFIDFSQKLRDVQEDGKGGYISENITYPEGTYWKADGSVFGCPCSIKPCIRKCCPPRHEYNETLVCVETNTTYFKTFEQRVFSKLNLSVIEFNDHYSFIHGDVCKGGRFLKEPEQYDEDRTYLMEDGKLLTTDEAFPYLDQTQYCLETFEGSDVVHTIECFEEGATEMVKDDWVFLVLASGMIVSIPFFLLTFLVYALLPQLQNLHGKSLMCHVFCLMVAYVCLAIIQIGNNNVSVELCVVLAFVVQFTFLSSFFWLNVMCFDIWWVFSGLMPLHGSIKEAEHKKFVIYSVYAWGGPLLISVTSILMEFLPAIPGTYIKPQFGVDRCWFKGADAQILYFYLPIGVLVALNLMMFITTSCRLRAQASDCKVLKTKDSQRHLENDRQRFNLYLKLFVVMGVTWVMELVSFAGGGSKIVWLVTDLCNTLQGLLIFIIFVCKPRILRLINQRFNLNLPLARTSTYVYNSSRTSSGRLSCTSNVKQSCKYPTQQSDIVRSGSNATLDLEEVDLINTKL